MTIGSRFSNYTVAFDDANALSTLLTDRKGVFIIDSRVHSLYRTTLLSGLPEEKVLAIEAREQSKSWDAVGDIFKKILALNIRKDSKIVAVGGGIIQDISGFVASTLFRGIQWHLVPTTLLSQADSCIGSKTSINLASAKNIIGTFYPPLSVVLQTAFLETLTYPDYLSGLGEIFKLAIIDGTEGYAHFESVLERLLARDNSETREVISWTLGIKKRYIEVDEFDHGIRNYLNFGHCFGHAVEIATAFEVPHGQAVTLGIVLADIVATKRGLLDNATADKHIRDAKQLLSFDIAKLRLNPVQMIDAMGKDKKRTGSGLALIISTTAGGMEKIDDLAAEEVRVALDNLKSI